MGADDMSQGFGRTTNIAECCSSGLRRAVLLATALLLGACGGGGGGGGGHGGGGGGGGVGGPPPVDVIVTATNDQTLVAPGATLLISASVRNAANQAVTWTLSGTNCPAACGTLNSTTSDPVTYSAPTNVPAQFVVRVTATSIQDTTKNASVMLSVPTSVCSAGGEAMLNGQYAFLLRGAGPNGSVAIAGSFSADGAGGISGGLEDQTPSAGAPSALAIGASSSSYTLGADGRGCLNLATSDGHVAQYRVAMAPASPATKGRAIEFDDATGTGTRMEGLLARQDASAFSTASVQGSFVLGWVGVDAAGQRVASAGVFSANAGTLSAGTIDVNDAGSLAATATSVAGAYSVDATGRGTATWTAGSATTHAVAYVVSATDVILLSSDPVDASHPLLSGQMAKQSAANFDATSLSAPAVAWVSGYDNARAASSASIGRVTPDAHGNFGLVLDTNDGGTLATTQSSSGTYSVASNGRAIATTGTSTSVLYLSAPNTGFVLGTDALVSFGRIEPQTTSQPITNASLTGAFAYGTEGAHPSSRLIACGSISFDGTQVNGTEDESTPGGLVPAVDFGPVAYSFSASSTVPGRGTLDPMGHQLAYLVSADKLVYFNTPALKPRIVVVER